MLNLQTILIVSRTIFLNHGLKQFLFYQKFEEKKMMLIRHFIARVERIQIVLFS